MPMMPIVPVSVVQGFKPTCGELVIKIQKAEVDAELSSNLVHGLIRQCPCSRRSRCALRPHLCPYSVDDLPRKANPRILCQDCSRLIHSRIEAHRQQSIPAHASLASLCPVAHGGKGRRNRMHRPSVRPVRGRDILESQQCLSLTARQRLRIRNSVRLYEAVEACCACPAFSWAGRSPCLSSCAVSSAADGSRGALCPAPTRSPGRRPPPVYARRYTLPFKIEQRRSPRLLTTITTSPHCCWRSAIRLLEMPSAHKEPQRSWPNPGCTSRHIPPPRESQIANHRD